MINKSNLVNLFLILFYITIVYRVFILKVYPSPPFYFDERDSLMDYINTCHWTVRDDKYTTWRSLYLPFSHFLCHVFNSFTGVPTDDLFKFRNENKPVLFLFVLTYLTQVFLLSKHLVSKLNNLRSVLILITFSTSVPIIFAYERGNLLVFGLICYSLVLISRSPLVKVIFAVLATSIKPYIFIFSIAEIIKIKSNRRVYTALIFIIIFAIIQIVSYVFITPQGIGNLSANLKYFSEFSSIHDLASYSFLGYSFTAYDTFKELFLYSNTELYLEYIVPFVLMAFKAISIFLFLYILVNFYYVIKHIYSKNFLNQCNPKWEVITLLAVFLFASISLKSGTYSVSFLIVALASLEGKVQIFHRNSIVFLLFFISLCFFDIPLVIEFPYPCNSLNYLSHITGIQYICGQKAFGVFTILRPLFLQVFFASYVLSLRKSCFSCLPMKEL